MSPTRRLFISVLIAAAFLAGGCRAVSVTPLAGGGQPPHSSIGNSARTRALVMPFRDARVRGANANEAFAISQIPVLGLASFFVADRRTEFPESAFAWGERFLFAGETGLSGGLAESVERAAARQLLEQGVADGVDLWRDLSPGTDVRRYDLVVRGELSGASTRQYRYSYGLNLFGIADLGQIPALLGLPRGRIAGKIDYAIVATERVGGRVVHQSNSDERESSVTYGYYYGNSSDGLPPYARVFEKLMER